MTDFNFMTGDDLQGTLTQIKTGSYYYSLGGYGYLTDGAADVGTMTGGASGHTSYSNIGELAPQVLPAAGFDYKLYAGRTVAFLNTSRDAVSYRWEFMRGLYSTAVNPVYVFPVAGTYTVSLTAYNISGKSTTIWRAITVTDVAETTDFNAYPVGSEVYFADTSTKLYPYYSWDFGDGTPVEQRSTPNLFAHTYAQNGTYTVTLTTPQGSKSLSVAVDNKNGTMALVNTVGPSINGHIITTLRDVCVHGGSLFIAGVVDGVECVAEWSLSDPLNPTWVRSYTHAQLVTPVALDAEADHIFVTCWQPPSAWVIWQFNRSDGTIEAGFPHVAELSYEPQGLAVDENYWYVADTLDHRILVLNKNGPPWTPEVATINLAVGTNPHAIKVTSGFIYVIESGTGCVSVYYKNHPTFGYNKITSIGSAGNDNAHYNTPRGLLVTDSLIYVGDSANYGNVVARHIASPYDVAFATGIVTTPVPGTIDGIGMFGDYLYFGDSVNNCIFIHRKPTFTYYPPTAIIDSDVDGGTAPLAVQFTDKSAGYPTSWVWDFGDGATATTQNPSHTYTEGGVYEVTLKATNSAGESYARVLIAVDAVVATLPVLPPRASFTAVPSLGAPPLTVNFTDTSDEGTPTSWVWDFGDGATATTQNPSHDYAGAGQFIVTLTVTDAKGWSSVAKRTVIVNTETDVNKNAPTAAITADHPSVYAGQDIVFGATVSTPCSYSWDFGDGTGSTDAAPQKRYSNGGTYTVRLTVSNAYGSTMTETEIRVLDARVSFGRTGAKRYLMDRPNHRVNIYDSTNVFITSFGGYGTASNKMKNPTRLFVLPPAIGG